MNDHSYYEKRQSILCGITIAVFFLTTHVLVEQKFFVKMLLSIADLEFWVHYFDPILDLAFAVIFMIIQRKMLLKSLKDYRENYKKYIPHVVIAVPITMILIVIVAITLSSFGIGDSTNEAAVNEALKVNPLIQGVTVIFIGPFVEEMIFRGFLYEKVRSLCDLEDFQSLKLMASYLIVFVEGLVMTGLYEKDRNIFSSLLLHCCINTIASLN
ncbi:MAG: CPBP family intramembrane metalloprotease [Lachnospiraceae bacterium]|nr:CPBP family intramembrane metalloprotease [Lachnospiraceae bacterium]